MKYKKKFLLFFFTVFAVLLVHAAAAADGIAQVEEKAKLAPRYRAFLAEARMLLSPVEKEVFQNLETDAERDRFIRQFWQSRGGRQEAVRANINLLKLMRMVQTLDLTEQQVAKILPAMNQNDREKQRLQNGILKELRELRVLIENEDAEEDVLLQKVRTIREMEGKLRKMEMEWNAFIEESLSVIQLARYVLFSQDFHRELRDKLNDARRFQQRLQQIRK